MIADIPSKDSTSSSDVTDAAVEPSRDTIEAKPGLIESTELAPLGEEKVAADRESHALNEPQSQWVDDVRVVSALTTAGLLTQATILGKKAYEAVVGSESK